MKVIINVPDEIVSALDARLRNGFGTRSEVIRAALRMFLSETPASADLGAVKRGPGRPKKVKLPLPEPCPYCQLDHHEWCYRHHPDAVPQPQPCNCQYPDHTPKPWPVPTVYAPIPKKLLFPDEAPEGACENCKRGKHGFCDNSSGRFTCPCDHKADLRRLRGEVPEVEVPIA